ncbi:MAG: endonuclease/exonuclease/phosphatase family protein [Kiritimatiellae bacterium]|nr:endonuclease/exonuclease/phosphatase family protein [Kiritimatiellia bacterium]
MKFLRSSMRLTRRVVFPCVGMLWLLGWWLGDRQPPLLWLFYIPAPLIAAWGLIDWALRLYRAGWARSGITIAITLLALSKTLLFDSRWNRPTPPPPGAIHVEHWNVAHAPFGYAPVLRALDADNADLIVFDEAKYSADLADLTEKELGLTHVFHDQGMAILSRYPFEPQGTISLPNARAWWAIIETPRGPLHVLTMDLLSHPALDRAPTMDALTMWLQDRTDTAPLIIVGDFNTTRSARALDPLRKFMRHAYEAGGRGWPYSWPLPIPVYAIDHAWVSTNIVVHNYRLRTSAMSDHARQDFTISFASAPKSDND